MSFVRAKSSDLQLLLIIVGHILYIHVLLSAKFCTKAINGLSHLVCCVDRQSVALVFLRVKYSNIVVTSLRSLFNVSIHAVCLVFEGLERALEYSLADESGVRRAFFDLLVQVKLHLG